MTHPLADEARAMLEGVNYATRDPETGDDLYPGAFAHITADELVKVSVTIAAMADALDAEVARRKRAEEERDEHWRQAMWHNCEHGKRISELRDAEARAEAALVRVAELEAALRKIEELDDQAECCGVGVQNSYSAPECCCQPLYGLDRAKAIAAATLAGKE